MTTVEVGAAPWVAPVPELPVRPQAPTDRIESDAARSSALAAGAAARRITPALERRRREQRRYRRRLVATDTAVIVIVTASASLLHLLAAGAPALAADPWVIFRLPFTAAVAWTVMLWAFQTRSPRVIGAGSTEYKLVAHATGLAFGFLAIAFIVLQWDGLRDQLILALPVGLLILLITRRGWRRWLIAQRRGGNHVSRAIVVGRRADIEHVISTLERDNQRAYQVVGAALDDAPAGSAVAVPAGTYPVVATPATVAEAAREMGADTIIVASQLEDAEYTRQLSWQLEGTAADLVLCSRLTDVAGPRISFRQVEGLPLVQVRIPSFEGARHAYKRALDLLVAVVALVPIALVTPVIALLVMLDSPGGVFFRQRRVGLNGQEFDMLKFRTMRASAEQELPALLAQNEGAGPLFKLRSDPRVTRVGAVLRRLSLDELPQFWNVLRGDMSVVGPRPPLPSEVGGYDGAVFRRLYIKPGITGLWQVSGRSDLSWEQSVRLDLHYVENWSLMTDLMIIWRTARVMIRPQGAY
ncbi:MULTISPECIES: sugar transferase [unclassified Microbacterium]|uniref:sugar transferase n=1 Tax=unclassified Microbacterium TaxID=2609290 RepID=UPI00214ADE8D|nr:MULTISPECIES: sugar transferase [unclassified Microbacterium]MCR2808949.1 sugar transferase [Microbacterium sp. zg.B185]WIM18634.1 sugar transferase [Microbacterium sp. zg-B185]